MINESQMMLGRDWDFDDVTGWFASEKRWDCRAYWDGKTFWTRGGNEIYAPDWFKAGLPDRALDGGIYIEGEATDRPAVQAARSGNFPRTAKFCVYDSPSGLGFYDSRIMEARGLLKDSSCSATCGPVQVTGRKMLAEFAAEVLSNGGEGLVLQNPKCGYIRGRSSNLLKLKTVPADYLFDGAEFGSW